jgi:hypothetical protein
MTISNAEKFGLNRMIAGYIQMQKQLPKFVDITEEMAALGAEIEALKPLLPVKGEVLYAEGDRDEITTQQIKVGTFVNAISGSNMFKVPNVPRNFANGIREVLSGSLKFNAFGEEGDIQLTKIGEALKALAMKLITNCGDQEVIDFYVNLDAKL